MPPIFSSWPRTARICSAFAMALSLAVLSTFVPEFSSRNVVYAGTSASTFSDVQGSSEPGSVVEAGNDYFCIQATVISHDEKPLGAGWNIVVTSPENGYEPTTGTTNSAGIAQFDLPVGEWTFSIQLTADYMPITPATFDITVEPTFTGCHVVRFKIKRIVRVTVIKLDHHHKPLADWIIRADPGPGFPFAKAVPIEATTDANGEATFHLTVGDWVFSEKAPSDVMFTPIVPVNGKIGVNIVAPGPHKIYFKNKIDPKGCIDVYKWAKADPDSGGIDFPLAQWRIDLLRADGSTVETKLTNINGRVRFTGLPFGPYWVEEETRIGWKPINPPKVHVVVDSEGCTRAYPEPSIVINFENYQDHSYCIEGRKVDENGLVGLPGWKIIAKPLNVGGFTPAPVFTDGLGKYRFELPKDDYRIPGASYEVCEVLQSGWENVTPICQTVKIWDRAGMCEIADDFINRQKPVPTVEIPPAITPDPKMVTPTPTLTPTPTYTPPPTPTHTPTHTATPYHPTPTPHYGKGHGHHHPKKPHAKHCTYHHVVRKGEGLFAIGTHYGKSAQEMIDANPEVRKSRNWFVYVGQQLCIP